MSEYTPTTERVRSDYAETFEGTDERRYERFDRWLAEVERAAAARALDLAADQWRYHWGSNGEETELWLRARAAEIREGK